MYKTELALQKVYNSPVPSAEDIKYLLSITDETEINTIFDFANRVRREYMGEGILLRGIVEFSNFCSKSCTYCGLSSSNSKLERYTLSKDQILVSAAQMASSGIKTIVLQSGESNEIGLKPLIEAIKEIKSLFQIAVTLSIGEKTYEEYKALKEAGADRYLLKIETSDKILYESLHPGMSFDERVKCLKYLEDLGFQVGSGIIVGLKGQTISSIAKDLLFFKKHDFDMIGIGPFIPHFDTPLKGMPKGDTMLTLKTIALTRIITRNSHIPATTALGSLEKDFRADGLKAGANVLMPNYTPQPFKKLYDIYPGKKCISEPTGACAGCMELLARSINRTIDYSIGNSKKAAQNA